jgi:hypothetical protein
MRRHHVLASFLRALPMAMAGILQVGCVMTSQADGRFVEREEKRFAVDGKPDVKLLTRDGAIEIRTWDKREVLVVIEKHAINKQAAAAVPVVSRQDGNHISVEVKPGREMSWWFWGAFGDARLIVSLPAESDVQASTGDGSIDLEGVKGSVSVQSGDGSIRVREVAGTLAARSGDGSIRLDSIKGAVDANTGDGSIAITGAFTGVRARSGDGSIVVHAQQGSATDSDWDISSGDGSVTVEMPDSFGAELEARTGDGGVHLDGITLSNVSGELSKNRASGRIGPGGHTMRVRTGDGSINLRRVSVQQ